MANILKRGRLPIYLILLVAVVLIALVIVVITFAFPGSDSVPAGAQPGRIAIAYCKDIAPFHYTDEKGQPAGIMIDLWRLWSEKTGISIDFKAAAWDKTLTMVGSGKADVHAGLFFSKERDEFLDYGEAFTKTDTHFFSHISLPSINDINSLAAYRVGVIKGDYVEGYLGDLAMFASCERAAAAGSSPE